MKHGPLAICYGTRPQVIKASMLIEACKPRFPMLTMDTGQHYDYKLNEVFYEQLGVRRPDHFLEVGSGAHAVQTSAVLTRAAAVFESAQPRAVVVIGDTNSTLGCALAAAQMRIPVVHVEAGLRAADKGMAEEINRRMVDALGDLLCAPSAAAKARLELEQQSGAIEFTGDIAHDVLRRNLSNSLPPSGEADWPLQPGTAYALATLHRAELTASPEVLQATVASLRSMPLPVVFPMHPRVSAAMTALGLRSGGMLRVMSPLGYFEMIGAIRDASVVITDSGGVQREAYWLGIPCVTMRTETEWHETVTLGANVLVPPANAKADLAKVVEARLGAERTWDRSAYGNGDAAARITDAIRILTANC